MIHTKINFKNVIYEQILDHSHKLGIVKLSVSLMECNPYVIGLEIFAMIAFQKLEYMTFEGLRYQICCIMHGLFIHITIRFLYFSVCKKENYSTIASSVL